MKSWRIESAGPREDRGAGAVSEGRRPALRASELRSAVLDGFEKHDLLTYSSAISFQILTAIIPFLLFVLAVAGLLHLDGVWRNHLEPEIRTHVSAAVFSVLSDAVNKVFSGGQLLWATFGGALALWQVSGAVRAVMGALSRIYGATRQRSFMKRYALSFVLSIEVGACFILAAICLLLAPFFSVAHPGATWYVFAFLARWTLGLGLLSLAVGLLVRHAPGTEQTLPWVSLGAGMVIATWALVSFVFYLYLTKVAAYESVFGSLAAVIVAMGYLYISTTVFLFGAQLDAIVRTRSARAPSGGQPAQGSDRAPA